MNSDSNTSHHRVSFLKRGSGFMLLDNLTKMLDPVFILLCARFYAGGEWGRFKYYESIALLLIRFSTVGLDYAVIWMHSRCRNESEFLHRFSRTLNFALMLSVVFAAGALAQHMGFLPGGHFASGMDIPVGQLLLYLGALPTHVATLLLVQALVNRRKLMIGLWVRNAVIPFGIYGMGALLFFTPLRGTALALSYFTGNALGLLAVWISTVRTFGHAKGSWSFSPLVPKEVFKYALPVSAAGALMSMANRFDILFLARYSGVAAVETYSIVLMVSNGMKALKSSMDNVLLSMFSHRTDTRMDRERKGYFDYVTWLVMAIQLPILAFALLFATDLLRLLSPHYAEGGPAMCLALFLGIVSTSISFTQVILLGLGRSFLMSLSQITFFAASFGLNMLLIPRLGAVGAVLAMGLGLTLAYVVSAIGVVWMGGWFFTRRLVIDFFKGSLFFIPTLLISFPLPQVGAAPLWTRIVVFSVCISGYAVFGWKTYRTWHIRLDIHAAKP